MGGGACYYKWSLQWSRAILTLEAGIGSRRCGFKVQSMRGVGQEAVAVPACQCGGCH